MLGESCSNCSAFPSIEVKAKVNLQYKSLVKC